MTREQLFTEAAAELGGAHWKVRLVAKKLEEAERPDLERRARVLESQTYKLLEDVAGAAAAELADRKKRELLEDEEDAQQERKVRPIRAAKGR